MPETDLRVRFLIAILCLCALMTGCKSDPVAIDGDEPDIVIPAHVKGTVAEFAALAGGNAPMQAFGVVVGLGNNGSSEVPAYLKKPIFEYLSRSGLGSYRLGTAGLSV